MDWTKFSKYWKTEQVGDSIEGTFVGIITKEIKGDTANIPVIEKEDHQIELPAHATLFRLLQANNVQEGEQILITYLGKKEGSGAAKGKLVNQYELVVNRKNE